METLVYFQRGEGYTYSKHLVQSSYLLHVPLPDPKSGVQKIRKNAKGFSMGVVTWIKSLIWLNGPRCALIKRKVAWA